MSQGEATSSLHRFFVAGVLTKGIHGVFDIAGALFMFFVSGSTIQNILSSILKTELVEDPNDVITNFLLNTSHSFTRGAQDFATLYLFVSGIINLVLAIALIRERRSAFPIALSFLGALIGYQAYLFIHTGSVWLIILALYDCLVFYVVAREYTRLKKTGFVDSLLPRG